MDGSVKENRYNRFHGGLNYEDLAHQKFVYCLNPWVIDLYEKKPDLFDMSLVDPGLLSPTDEDDY